MGAGLAAQMATLVVRILDTAYRMIVAQVVQTIQVTKAVVAEEIPVAEAMKAYKNYTTGRIGETRRTKTAAVRE